MSQKKRKKIQPSLLYEYFQQNHLQLLSNLEVFPHSLFFFFFFFFLFDVVNSSSFIKE